MSTPTYKLAGIRRGNTYRVAFRFLDNLAAPINLTGGEVVFFCETADEDEPIRKVLTNDDPSPGAVTLELSPEETRSLLRGTSLSWEIELRLAGEQKTLIAGQMSVEDSVNDDEEP